MNHMATKQMVDLAIRLGEREILRADANASEVWRLRNAIKRALALLCVGQIDQARVVLEQESLGRKMKRR